jgi:polyisoprenoid-binding protein YceI
MKRLAFAAGLLAIAGSAGAADIYNVDKAHSEVSFQVKHLMSNVRGRFTDFSGAVSVDTVRPEASSVEFKIQATSVDTAIADRDKHLRSADFFDVEKFPEISFKSSSISKTGANSYTVTGSFTMHGVTKQVTLPVTFNGFAKDPWGGERAGFELATTLNRKDYGIVWNKALDAGGMLLSDDVRIEISLEAVKQKAPAAGK